VIYFAYNSGRLVRTETTVDFNANLGADQISALGIGSSSAPADASGASAPAPYAGIMNDGPQPDANGNLPGDPGYQGSQGGFQGGYQAPAAAPVLQSTPVHLKFLDVTTLLT
jgi:hypothetical protein